MFTYVYRQWLSNPMRKLSHGKFDRTSTPDSKNSSDDAISKQNKREKKAGKFTTLKVPHLNSLLLRYRTVFKFTTLKVLHLRSLL